MYLTISNPAGYCAGLYIRLSREDEREGPSQSVQNQRAMLETFVRQNKIAVYDVYIDDGWSGTSFDRPAFQRLLADIEAGRVNMVITKDLSRLGRDYILTGHYLERYFPEHRVRYLSLLDGVDTGVESTANDITPLRAIMNDMYAKDISKKIKSVKRDKQRRGEFIGGKPAYGYRMHPTQKNHIIPDEPAATVVQEVFSLALQGKSCRQIARLLNQRGIPTPAAYAGLTIANPGPHSGQWSAERISQMLQNEVYLGTMVQGRSVKISYKTSRCRRQPREDWIVVPGTHAPLVERAVFDAVQQLLASRRQTRMRTYDFLLKGLVYCRECGKPLSVINRRGKAGQDRLYLICRTYQRDTQAGICSSHCIREQALTGAVLEQVQRLCRPLLKAEFLSPVLQRILQQHNGRWNTGFRSLQGKLQGINTRLDQMYLDRLNGLLQEQDFARIYEKLCRERQDAEEKLRRLQQTSGQAVGQNWIADFLQQAESDRALLCRLIRRIEIDQQKQVIIFFRFPQPEEAEANLLMPE